MAATPVLVHFDIFFALQNLKRNMFWKAKAVNKRDRVRFAAHQPINVHWRPIRWFIIRRMDKIVLYRFSGTMNRQAAYNGNNGDHVYEYKSYNDSFDRFRDPEVSANGSTAAAVAASSAASSGGYDSRWSSILNWWPTLSVWLDDYIIFSIFGHLH